MKTKRLAIAIFAVIFVAVTAISFFSYDKSTAVGIICEKDSYAEKYAQKHNIEYQTIADSQKNIGILNLEDFEYNNDGTIVAYNGKSEVIAIPDQIGDVTIRRVDADAFDDAKNLKEIYLPESVVLFEPTKLNGVDVYVYENSTIYRILTWKDENKIDFKVDSADIREVVVSNPSDFDVDKDGKITKYTGSDAIIRIPATINSKKITAVDKDAFLSAKLLTEVYLPDTVTSYGPDAVEGVSVFVSDNSSLSGEKFKKGAVSADALVSDYADFEIDEDGEITAYLGSDKNIVIPEEISGETVISVAEDAFEKAPNVKNVYTPDTIIIFWPTVLDKITVYVPENAILNDVREGHKYDFLTFADSYYVNFNTSTDLYEYDELSNKEIEIKYYNGAEECIIIPETIDGKTVTAISVDPSATGATSILIPASVEDINTDLYSPKYDAAFFIGLLIALVGFVMALVAVLKVDIETKKKTFLRLSVFTTAYTVSVLSALFAVLYMFILPMFFDVPVWLGAVFIVLIVAFGVTSFVKSNTAVAHVEEVEQKVKQKTFFIKALTVDADILVSKVENAEIKAICTKVYEAIRYSDPMSNDALATAELEIENHFKAFNEAALAGDVELAQTVSKTLLESIEARNKKCKLLK